VSDGALVWWFGRTSIVDNGTEFHAYAALEGEVSARFCFATPAPLREREISENTNHLLRPQFPERASTVQLTLQDFDRRATKPHRRSRK
jgi:IS30 family transposase